jgi:2-haloacid dehalogenase
LTSKPDPEIFMRLLRRYSLDAGRTLLVDDSAANVDAAARLGMRALHFVSADRLRVRLVDLGLLDR